MSNITKGEWYVRGDKYPSIESRNNHPVHVLTHPTIATVNSCMIDKVQYTANAKLIASAPFLLETLKKLDNKGGLGIDVHRWIRDAINVAEDAS